MKKDNITRYADLLAALGSTARLTIVRLLVKKHPQGMMQGEIQARLKIPQAKLMPHLAKLQQQGLVRSRQEDQYLYYGIDVDLLEDLLAFFYAECCVRRRVVDWSKVSERKDELITENHFLYIPEDDDLEHLIDGAIYDRLGGKSLQVLLLARNEAARLNHNFIGTEQILLGLMGEGSGEAARSLKSWGMDLVQTRKEVKEFIGEGRGTGEEVPLTPKAKRVLEFSLEEAIAGGNLLINTEHILLGLIREWQASWEIKDTLSVASRLLSQLSLDAKTMMEELRSY
ncbi:MULTISPECIES: metalloregulator ArsR/SmtB family transcription factor [Spirulina sp. CCY15215]|uniref:ArsR/SmtB family transcription factor n=1 Tax=Spirulina sp. CCY15215 TaxID=2767591 RepID=UPI001950FB13|nr:metalloregulator ArsR/SmtB family transcription factor [Spirulina major]